MKLNRRKFTQIVGMVGVGAHLYPTIGLAQDKEFTFHAGSIGGTYFIVGAAFVSAWQEMIPGFNASVVPGGGLTNIINVSKSTDGNDVGLSTASMLKQARSGTGEFEVQGFGQITNVRALANLGYGSMLHFSLLRDRKPAEVKTLGELLALKPALDISVGPRGTAGELSIRKVLELYSVDYETLESWGGSVQHSDPSDAINGMRDGRLDGIWQDFPPYHPGLTELSISRDFDLLSINPEILEQYSEEVGADSTTMPGGVYNGIDYSVDTIFEPYILIANEATDTEAVTQMTKIVLENKPRWVSAFRGLSVFDPATASKTPIPLHEGAEAAYKQLGYEL